jgi:hypothetical protein
MYKIKCTDTPDPDTPFVPVCPVMHFTCTKRIKSAPANKDPRDGGLVRKEGHLGAALQGYVCYPGPKFREQYYMHACTYCDLCTCMQG